MTERVAAAGPRSRARLTGAIYLLYFLTAVSGEFFLRGIVVPGDAGATANNIVAHELLFRLGVGTGLIATALYVAMAVLFYSLFKPVNRNFSLLAAFLGLVGSAIQAVGSLFNSRPWSF